MNKSLQKQNDNQSILKYSMQVHAYTQERRVWAQQLNKIIDEIQRVLEPQLDTWNGHSVSRQFYSWGGSARNISGEVTLV